VQHRRPGGGGCGGGAIGRDGSGIGGEFGGATNEPGQTQLGGIAQHADLGLSGELAHFVGHRGGQLGQEFFAVHGLGRAAAVAAAFHGATLATVVQQGVELGGDELAHAAQGIEQLAGGAVAVGRQHLGAFALEAQRFGDPGEVFVLRGQQVRLLVIEVLDAVLDAAQEDVGLGQPVGGGRGQQAACGQAGQGAQRGAGADLGELATADHLQQLHGEFDFADATARELDVVGAVRAAGGALVGFVADLAVQLAQAFKHAVIQVAAVNKGHHQIPQGQGAGVVLAARLAAAGRHDAALEPGKALPFAALHQEVLFQHPQADHGRAGVAVGAQGQVDAENEAVFGGVANQRGQAARHQAEVLVGADLATGDAIGAGDAGGLTLVFVDVDEVDV
jgi:hypothetical protein